MPQSLSAVHVHVVFSTKGRRPFQDREKRQALHEYLGGISNCLGCPPEKIGGAEDHVHVLVRLGRSVSQAELVKELKRVSSLWLKEQGDEFAAFEWQGGYAAFSVSASNIDQVKAYIANQEEHHRRMTFQDELRELLRRHGLEWDERYLWD
jgi:putative transposase